MKIVFLGFLIGMVLNIQAQDISNDKLTSEEVMQLNYMKNAMQKEIWRIVLTDTFELQQNELKQGIIFKEDNKHDILKYQEILTEICVEEKTSSCPEIFFTHKKNIPAASMYPNGKMYLNIDLIDKLSNDEIYFVIAHEMGHFVLQHSLKNTQFMANSIIDSGLMVADIDKLVAASFMIPGIKKFHYQIEAEADEFAIKYIKKKNIKINCITMFKKIIGDEKVSTEQHAGTEERCKMIEYSYYKI
jgi:Zn-dependent protease with chaperone function